MSQKYDLKKMLEEIDVDEKIDHPTKSRQVSQDEIKKLLEQKKERI